jgi:transcriptional regulator with XRE-family HTH domain
MQNVSFFNGATIMINNMEFGYTPANLKGLRQKYGLTQQQVADITKSALPTAQRWEMMPGQKNYINMPHTKWLELLQFLAQR